MSKIKINLASGTSIEKPLITCFKGTNGNYIVFDNETNGQMGYPIICISKFNGTSVDKVTDQGEWASIKENLKTIIGGTALPYFSVPESLSAPDDFFTQLTLPVASFDLLKSVYAPVASEPEPVSAQPIETPAAPTSEPAPATPSAPITPEPTSVGPSPIIAPAPVIDAPASATPSEPVMTAPVIDMAVNITPPVAEPVSTPIAPVPVSEVPPAPAPLEITTPQAPAGNNDEIQALKESFMKSCENMFDALIKKFEK